MKSKLALTVGLSSAMAMAMALVATQSLSLPIADPDPEAGDRANQVIAGTLDMPAEDFERVAAYGNALLSANEGKGGRRTIYAQDLMDGVDDPEKVDELSDYFLLDIRTADEYAAGHLDGSVHIPLGEVATPESLALLPTDKPILIICSTGHTASVANGVLGMLGYDAWTLRFGMTAWVESSPTKVWSPEVTQEITGGGFPVVTGDAP